LDKRKNEREKIYDNQEYQDDIYDDYLNRTIEMNERYRLYQKHFQNLGKDCQKILQMFFNKIPLRQIAQVMGFKGEKYAKKRKYKCKEYLIKSIKQDMEYKKILEDDF
jgi:hypothetical protein